MDKIKFDIAYRSQIENGEYKVFTRQEKPVRIVCWDAKGRFPIVGLMQNAPGYEISLQFTKKGKFGYIEPTSIFDLFLVENNEEDPKYENLDTLIESLSKLYPEVSYAKLVRIAKACYDKGFDTALSIFTKSF